MEREFRAAWISPTEAGDWPSRPGLSVAEQKTELTAVLDAAQADGLNAVLLHVRTAADALYPTKRAPWSRYLTGPDGASLGSYAGYDPVALATDEAHARGLQLHVWFNPFRAMPPDNLGKAAVGHVTRTHPQWPVVSRGDADYFKGPKSTASKATQASPQRLPRTDADR